MFAITDESIGFHVAGQLASAAAAATARSSPIDAREERTGHPAHPLATLLEATANGDRNALHRLYELNAAKLLGVATRILRRQDLAEEALHDAFISIWANAGKYDRHLSSPMTWMVTILRNRCLDMLRRAEHEVPVASADGDEDWLERIESEEPGPMDHAQHAEDTRKLSECLRKLDPNQRAAILLVYYNGLSHPELAARLGAPLGTVKTWVRRGVKSLQAAMGDRH
ncbi:MAG: sigma-70 family RNA polymerase sigma factor [Burkholderiales bacterium]